MAFAGIQFEFYEAPTLGSVYQGRVYGRLISSSNDTSVSGTENLSIPKNAAVMSVYADAEHFIEMGTGNQDVGSTRKAIIPATQRIDFQVSMGEDTVSYAAA